MAELVERRIGHHRQPAVLLERARLIAPDHSDGAAHERGQGLGPWAVEFVTERRQAADDAFEGGAVAHVAVDHPPVGERQSQDRRVGIRPGPHLDQRGDEQLVDEPVRIVDDEEPPILGHAALGDRDLVASFQPEAHDRGDVQVRHGRHGAMLPDEPARRRASLADAARHRPPRHRLRGPGRCGGGPGAGSRPACRLAAADTMRSARTTGWSGSVTRISSSSASSIGRWRSASWVGAPTVQALAAGGGLATWAVVTDDIDGDVVRLNDGGAGLADADRRRTASARTARSVRWRLAMPRELGPGTPAVPHRTRPGLRRVVARGPSGTRRGHATRSAGPCA